MFSLSGKGAGKITQAFSFTTIWFYSPSGLTGFSFPRFSAENKKTLCSLCLCERFKIISVLLVVILSLSLSLHAQPPYISTTSVIHQHKQNKVFLIDVRSKEAFDELNIPGSLNISLYAIKTRPFLKAKPLILINEGYATTLLEQECTKLNQSGFTASCLQGGINAWHLKKGPIEGNLFTMKSIQLVSPQTVLQEKDAQNHIVIDISQTPQKGGIPLFPEAVLIPEKTPAEQQTKNSSLCALCASVRDIIKKTPSTSILITNQDGKGYDHIMKKLSDQDIGPVFFLEGGLSGYERFMNHLALSRQPKDTRLKTINKCRTCGEKNKEKKE